MTAHREELKQSIEGLKATQEQLKRQLNDVERTKADLAGQLKIRDTVLRQIYACSESNPSGVITAVNEKLCEISGYAHHELIGNSYNIFRHPDSPDGLFKKMWTTITHGKVFAAIIKNRAKDGSHYWLEATIIPIMDDQRDITKYISACYHIPSDDAAEILYRCQAIKLGLAVEIAANGLTSF